jgi:GNAT superfamily N-acetyltransferase
MYARTGKDGEAEFAVLVEDGWQSRGVGRLLLTELATVARSRGIGFFTGSVLGENRRALSALAAVYSGMRYEIRDGSYQVRVPLGPLEATAERAA